MLDRWASFAQHPEIILPPAGRCFSGLSCAIVALLDILLPNAGSTGMRPALCGKRPVGAITMTTQSVQTTALALRPRDAARALGISPRLLWQLTHDGHIPFVKAG